MIPFMGGRRIVTKTGVVTRHRNGLGKGFSGLGRYLKEGPQQTPKKESDVVSKRPKMPDGTAAKPTRALWVETRNLPATTPEAATRYMADYARTVNSRVENPVYHFGVSLSPEEELTREQWRDVTETMLRRLGLDEHQALIVAHGDKDYQHVHIVANRVGPDGRVWKPRHDRRIQQAVARELEVKYGLRRVPTLKDRRLEKLRRLGIHPDDPATSLYLSSTLQERVAALRTDTLNEATSWREFEQRLAEKLVFLEPAKRGTGLVITDGVEKMHLSKFHRSYSGPRLATRYGETYRAYLDRTASSKELEEVPEVSIPLEQRADAILDKLSQHHAVFERSDVAYLARNDAEPQKLVEAVLAKPRIVELSKDRFAQKTTVELEAQLFGRSDAIHASTTHRLHRDDVDQLLARKYAYLNAEQLAAVRDATTGRDLHLIVGHAGVGKTTLTNAIAESYQRAGYRVLGAAPQGAAAERLQAETGLDSRTLASWSSHWKRSPMDAKTILIVDEAGLADTETMAEMLAHVKEAGAKVIPVGDDSQLTPVGPGNPFPVMKARYGASVVPKILRQNDQWQRDASMALAAGRIPEAIDAYRDHGNLHLANTEHQAIDTMIEHHLANQNLLPNESHVILAHRRRDVDEITRRIRDARQNIGELQDEVRFGKRTFAKGDLIRFRQNDHRGRNVRNLVPGEEAVGVKNGTFGTVAAVSDEHMMVRLHSGRMVEFDPREYRRFVHGYAMTIHASQGLTVDRTSVYATPTLDKHLTNVAFTRHRKGLDVFTDRENFEDLKSFKKRLSRTPKLDSASAHLDTLKVFRGSDETYLRQTMGTMYVSPREAEAALASRLEVQDREEVYQALIEDPTQLGVLRPAPETTETARRHFRNALALNEASPTPAPLAPKKLLDASIEPEVLDKLAESDLKTLSNELNRWDRQVADLQRLTTQRSALPDGGDLKRLEARVQKLVALPADQAYRIYRDPEAALHAFAEVERQGGSQTALHQLRDNPARFGELRGMPVLKPAPRREADAAIAALTRPERLGEVAMYPKAYQRAKVLRQRQLRLTATLQKVAPRREDLVARMRQVAAKLPPRRAQDLVAPDHRRLLIRTGIPDARASQQLTRLAKKMGNRRLATISSRRLTQAAFAAHGLLRNPSLRILRELSPSQLRVVYTLRNLKQTARKLGLLVEETPKESI